MSTVICSNQGCPYRGAVFCTFEHVIINAFGQCDVLYYSNGNPRQVPKQRVVKKRENPSTPAADKIPSINQESEVTTEITEEEQKITEEQ